MFEELTIEEIMQLEKETVQSQMFENELTFEEQKFLLDKMHKIKQSQNTTL